MAKPLVQFDWDVRSLRKLEKKLGRRRDVLVDDTGAFMVETIRSKIRSRTGRLAASWNYRVAGNNVTISSRTPYTWASIKGNFIAPKSKMALAFDIGGSRIFAHRVRYAPGSYLGKPGSPLNYLDESAKEFGKVANAAFNDAFGDLGPRGSGGINLARAFSKAKRAFSAVERL